MTPDEVLASLAGPPWAEIGRSVEDRPIVAGRWDGTSEAAPVLLFGAIHGEEPLGVACLLRLAAELALEAPARPTWIVPIVNPDGYRLGRRHNSRGVDLNRNLPASNWTKECRPGYEPGERPASEPETRVLMDLVERSGARRIVAIHSPFRVVNWDGPARALAERMAAENGYGASGDIGYPTPGSVGSYFALDRGLEVVTLEIPTVTEEQAWQENRGALRVALSP